MRVKNRVVFGVLILIVSVIYFLLTSKKAEIPDGGPCTYTITAHSAKVIAIHAIDSIRYDVLFEVNLPGKTDTLSFNSTQKHFATSEEIASYGLIFGEAFRYEEHSITSGECTPHFYVLKMEKF